MTPPLPELVAVTGGDVVMSDARRGTTRRVALQPYEIAVAPVTSAECVGAGAHAAGTNVEDEAERPAVSVSWLDSVAWCNLISDREGLARAYFFEPTLVHWDPSADGYRLPTEAEWEFACRAATSGPTYGPLADIAWSAADGVTGPQPVRRKQSNGWGLYDMLGNVWEWCWDYADPARYFDYRTLKGGGWSDPRWSCRVGVRRGSVPGARLDDVGFRVARGAVTEVDTSAAQGWSADEDRARAAIAGPIPVGWTPLRDLLDRTPHLGRGTATS